MLEAIQALEEYLQQIAEIPLKVDSTMQMVNSLIEAAQTALQRAYNYVHLAKYILIGAGIVIIIAFICLFVIESECKDMQKQLDEIKELLSDHGENKEG